MNDTYKAGRHRGSVRRGETKRAATSTRLPSQRTMNTNGSSGRQRRSTKGFHASQDIISLPPPSQHATYTHRSVSRHLHHFRHWPPNETTWRSTERGGWLTVDDDPPATSELATARSQSSLQASSDYRINQSHYAEPPGSTGQGRASHASHGLAWSRRCAPIANSPLPVAALSGL